MAPDDRKREGEEPLLGLPHFEKMSKPKTRRWKKRRKLVRRSKHRRGYGK
jgi:hypothetical protein